MTKILVLFISIVTLFFFVQGHTPLLAHLGIMYVPQITINSVPEVENTIIDFTTPHTLKLAISKAEKPFIVGESISFDALETSTSAHMKDITYQWNFNDNTSVEKGIHVNHRFKMPGTYVIQLQKGAQNQTLMQVVDTLKIDIIPFSDYILPQADFTANGKPIVKKFINFTELNNTQILFEASGSAVKKYIWDFSDGQSAEGARVDYKYKGKSNSVTTILRVVDNNNLIGETYSIIAFKDLPPNPTTIPDNTKNSNSVIKLLQKIFHFFSFKNK